jgi:nucleoside-diphosphate-sugar epimerase
MRTALVLGASGAVGRFLLPRLVARGDRVLALSRRERPDMPGVRWLRGHLPGGTPPLPPLDAIFSLGPLDACARWYADSPVACARIVALGSMSAESKRDSADAGERALAARLREAEMRLMDAAGARGAACTLLRPTLVYGAGVDRSLAPIARFALRWRVFPLLPGARGLRQPVHAEDLALGCLAACDRAPASGRTYALGGGERLSLSAMLERVRASLGTPTLPLPVPLALARALIGSARRAGLPLSGTMIDRAAVDLVADHAPAVADLGWTPRAFAPEASMWSAA